MSGAPDYYAVLGLSPQADDVVIHAAWKALLRKHHPDTNASDHAAARAREINEAFAFLGKPDSRADYDRTRERPVIITPHWPTSHAAPMFRPGPPRRRGIVGPAISLLALLLIAVPIAALALLANPDTAPATHRTLAAYAVGSPLASTLLARFERLTPQSSTEPAEPDTPRDEPANEDGAGR